MLARPRLLLSAVAVAALVAGCAPALVEGNAAGSEEGSERVRETGMQAMLEKAAEYGWAEYRAGPHFQDAVSSHYSWNNYSLRRFNETLKDAIDPNGIIAPGRGGIWPANYRNRG